MSRISFCLSPVVHFYKKRPYQLQTATEKITRTPTLEQIFSTKEPEPQICDHGPPPRLNLTIRNPDNSEEQMSPKAISLSISIPFTPPSSPYAYDKSPLSPKTLAEMAHLRKQESEERMNALENALQQFHMSVTPMSQCTPASCRPISPNNSLSPLSLSPRVSESVNL